jgi:hypothetical protein
MLRTVSDKNKCVFFTNIYFFAPYNATKKSIIFTCCHISLFTGT